MSSIADAGGQRTVEVPTQRNPNKNEIIETEHPIFVFDAQDVEQDDNARTLYDAYLELRCDFVQKMKWFDSRADDTDVYDSPELTTKYFVRLHENDRGSVNESAAEVLVGMRLTRVRNVRSSLSWSMLNEPMKEEILSENGEDIKWLNEVGKANKLWDLTRLVNQLDGRAGSRETVEAMLTVFGAGLGEVKTDDESDDLPISWIFLTTPYIKRLLDRSGIRHRVIASGKVDVHDNKESYLCIVDPAESYSTLAEADDTMHKRTFQLVSGGLRNAHAL